MPTMEITMKKIKSAAPAMVGKRPLVSTVLEQKLEKFVNSASYTKRWWPEILVENTYQKRIMRKLLAAKRKEAIANDQRPLKFIKVGIASEKRERRRARRQNQLEKQAFDQAFQRLLDIENHALRFTDVEEGYYYPDLTPITLASHYRIARAMVSYGEWDWLMSRYYAKTKPRSVDILDAINLLVKVGFVVKQHPLYYDIFLDEDVYKPLDSVPSRTFVEKGVVVTLVY